MNRIWLTSNPFPETIGYAADGSRLVAGVVAVSSDKRKVLVVESTNRSNHWVLPKGGYETDEATPEDAAARKPANLLPHYHLPHSTLAIILSSQHTTNLSTGEAWEEAGILGKVVRSLGEIRDSRSPVTINPAKAPRALYFFFEFHVEKEESQWPEMHKRRRKWLTYEEAKRCFSIMNRPELLEALNRSSVVR